MAGSGDQGVNWKERCETMEGSLLKFKQQASRIRELLSNKMDEMEERLQEAEDRAAAAEHERSLLEAKLDSMVQPTPEADSGIHDLENEVREKDKIIETLRLQLEEQKLMRVQEAKMVEEKSAKIKDWVSKKMKELEYQNQQFQIENDTLRDQIGVLRARLNMLPPGAAKEIHRISAQSSQASILSEDIPPPDIPRRPSSSILETFRRERELHMMKEGRYHLTPQRSAHSPSPEDILVDEDASNLEPDYQEIDDNHESKYEPKRVAPPQVRIERKVFQSAKLYASMSSTNDSEDMLEADTDPYSSVALDFEPQITSSTGDIPEEYNGSPVTLTPKEPPTPLSAFDLNPPPNTPAFSFSYSRENTPPVTADMAGYAVPPRLAAKQGQTLDVRGQGQAAAAKDDGKMDVETVAETLLRRKRSSTPKPKPPTPPMRRLPSWETRIYAVANTGLAVADHSDSMEHRESSCPVTDTLYMEQMYQDLAVPVFTTIKGKAAQIRSTPFTGDSSSDSSDNEEGRGTSCSPNTDEEAVTTVAGPYGGKSTNNALIKKQGSQTPSGATKRGSSQTLGSETSSDYAVPPDEVSIRDDSSESSEPEHKLLKCATENIKRDALEKTGYLTKLGGKVKSWRRRWFVLRNGQLLYYKSANDIARKPQGHISLDSQTRISKSESALTFEITTSKRHYYFCANSMEDMEIWVKVLQNNLRKQAADKVMSQLNIRETMKGWLIKTKNGRCRRCWCVLMGKFFMYYRSPNDKTPLGQVHLRDARVEEVDRSCDSDSDSDDTGLPDFTIVIWPKLQGPTYLMLPTKHEKDSWLYHLTVASGGGSGKVGTEYEQMISKLMEVEGDPGCVCWKHPALLHTKEPLAKPLTTLPSEDLQGRAMDLFKSGHLFMNMAIESPQIDYHVALAQKILDTCLQYPELQNELYCQLIKQTSRHPPQQKSGNFLLCGSHSWFLCDASPTSPTSSVADLTESKLNPPSHVFLQGWQLLSMCVSLFLPRQSVLWYLKMHLHKNSDPRTDTGKYAIFCQRALERTMKNGTRESRPSRMEVLSILLRNPFHHSQPISIPVHFLNSTYQVVSFDGSTTVNEFLHSLNKAISMRDCALSGFSLFTDDPAGQELEHCLKGHLKLCDVISKWEQAFQHHHRNSFDINRTVRLTYKNRLYFKSMARTESDREKLLLAYQVNEEIVHGRFPVTSDLAIELCSLLSQVELGDMKQPGDACTLGRQSPATLQQQQTTLVTRFYPRRYREETEDATSEVYCRFSDKWLALRGRTVQDCVRIYLTVTRKWPFFGSKLFSAKIKPDQGQVWLAVQEEGISILEYATLRPISSFEYTSVVTFGGCRDDFMLVVLEERERTEGLVHSSTGRLLFSMTKPKILEITMLTASYINSRGQQRTKEPSVSSSCGTRSASVSRYSDHHISFIKTSSMEC